MPILDLLASITGEEPSPAPAVVARPSVPLPKRKAEDELRPASQKVARTAPVPDKPYRPTAAPPKPSVRPADRPLGGSGDSRQPVKPRPALDKKPGVAASRPGGTGTTSSNASKPLPARPIANRPSPTDSGPPKKRSYAEIMARAKASTEQRESLGKIQHKTVERSMTMKERKEMKAGETTRARMEKRKAMASSRPGAASTPSRGTPVRDVSKPSGSRNAVAPASTSTKKSAPVEEKKVKKAALATTGYTGTARPRPGASTASKPGAASRGGSETQSRDRPRYGGPLSTRRRREEDEEMDDFIVDDEEDEEQQGYGTERQYRYDSYDEESDMEAGLSDIEGEEQTADRYARREDQEQEALEKRLKREKEERKQKFLESTKSRAGGR
ncbi:hypothetical protein C8A05DRAFT_34721 [Staphylotrichum tortipilum]|uniref:SPT2 chromatin protein n=1 Tax=Staphylotrichum tortipilum TaxID=2831512 RepID=A0AAN6RTI9_9PEZI|nr:hypothetical protein C8A05DRAFT_34721 [Staphylotrichum longicolle]